MVRSICEATIRRGRCIRPQQSHRCNCGLGSLPASDRPYLSVAMTAIDIECRDCDGVMKTARRWRPEATVVEVCTTSPESPGKPKVLVNLALRRQISGQRLTTARISAPRDSILAQFQICEHTITLTQILEDSNLAKIDFMAIDVEEFDMEVLAGLDCRITANVDFSKTVKPEDIRNLLSASFRFISIVSDHDYLFEHLPNATESEDEDVLQQ